MKERKTSEIEIMLQEWAQWSHNCAENLSYPTQSNIFALMQLGIMVKPTYGPKPMLENPIAEKMDSWILRLKVYKPIEADALIFYYLSGWMKETLSKKLGISIRTLDLRIATAKTWLEGCYEGQERFR